MGRRAGRRRLTRREKIKQNLKTPEPQSGKTPALRQVSPMMRDLVEAAAGLLDRKPGALNSLDSGQRTCRNDEEVAR